MIEFADQVWITFLRDKTIRPERSFFCLVVTQQPSEFDQVASLSRPGAPIRSKISGTFFEELHFYPATTTHTRVTRGWF